MLKIPFENWLVFSRNYISVGPAFLRNFLGNFLGKSCSANIHATSYKYFQDLKVLFAEVVNMRACALDHKSIRSTYMGDKFIFGCPSPLPCQTQTNCGQRGGSKWIWRWGRGRGRSYNTSPLYLPHLPQIIYKFKYLL